MSVENSTLKTGRTTMHYKSAAIAVVLGSVALLPASAQSPTHVMVAPADLKWAAMPNFPCNAQLAVIEGPMNEAKPFTVRLKFPADCKIPPHYHPAIEH